MQFFLPYTLDGLVQSRVTKHIYFLRNPDRPGLVKVNLNGTTNNPIDDLLATKLWVRNKCSPCGFEACYLEDMEVTTYFNGKDTNSVYYPFTLKDKMYRLSLTDINDDRTNFKVVEIGSNMTVHTFNVDHIVARDFSVQASEDFIWLFNYCRFYLIRDWDKPRLFDANDRSAFNFRINRSGLIYIFYRSYNVQRYKVFSTITLQFTEVKNLEASVADIIIPRGDEFYIISNNGSFSKVSLDGKCVSLGQVPQMRGIDQMPGFPGDSHHSYETWYNKLIMGIAIDGGLWCTGVDGIYIYNECDRSVEPFGLWKKVSDRYIRCPLHIIPYYG